MREVRFSFSSDDHKGGRIRTVEEMKDPLEKKELITQSLHYLIRHDPADVS